MAPSEIDATPGHRLDWLLLVHDTVTQVQQEKQQEASGGGTGPV